MLGECGSLPRCTIKRDDARKISESDVVVLGIACVQSARDSLGYFCRHLVENSTELQCVAECCSVLQCVAVCCSVLQCLAVSCSEL